MVKISGIYAYYDNLRCEIVYVGRDSNIEKNVRHKEHHQLSKKDKQVINKILQNDNKSGRYTYLILERGDFTDDELNQKEISWISFFNPRFNFTEGGDGVGSGEKHPMYGRTGKKSPFYGREHSEEARKKIGEAQKGKKLSDKTKKKMSEAKKGENHPQFNSCIKIRKQKNKTCKQGFRWNTEVSIPEKRIFISSVDLQKCIKKVEEFINSERNVYCYESYEVVE